MRHTAVQAVRVSFRRLRWSSTGKSSSPKLAARVLSAKDVAIVSFVRQFSLYDDQYEVKPHKGQGARPVVQEKFSRKVLPHLAIARVPQAYRSALALSAFSRSSLGHRLGNSSKGVWCVVLRVTPYTHHRRMLRLRCVIFSPAGLFDIFLYKQNGWYASPKI